MEFKKGDLVVVNAKGFHKYNGCYGEITIKLPNSSEWYFVKMNDFLCLELHESEMIKC
jgi:hypothetical protein